MPDADLGMTGLRFDLEHGGFDKYVFAFSFYRGVSKIVHRLPGGRVGERAKPAGNLSGFFILPVSSVIAAKALVSDFRNLEGEINFTSLVSIVKWF